MITPARVRSVEYYLSKHTQADADAKRDAGVYYTDNNVEESKPGQFWNSKGAHGSISRTETGRIVDAKDFRDLANGIDPETKQHYRQQQNHENSTVGYDFQFALPKSVSVLWSMSDLEKREKIEQVLQNAVFKTLDYVKDEGMITTRRGKGSLIHEIPAEIAAGTFLHTTSREGDPQLHVHAVIANLCVREDGTTGGIDNAHMMKRQHELNAVFSLNFIREIKDALDVKIERDGHNFQIAGVPEAVCDALSTRRKQMEEAAAESGHSLADRKLADKIALATRKKKLKNDGYEYRKEQWLETIKEESGMSIETLKEIVRLKSTEQHRHEMTASEATLAELEENSATIKEKDIKLTLLENFYERGSLDEAEAELAKLMKSPALVLLGEDEHGKVYATQAQIDREKFVVRTALERKNTFNVIQEKEIENAIAKRPTMSDEQAEAVRHALNQDGVVVVEGSAGTGKSFSLGTVTECAREAGCRVFVTAPSHKAKDVISADTNSSEEDTHTIQGFIAKCRAGLITPAEKDVVVVDEAGMVDTKSVYDLLKIAEKHDMKVILAGDTKQLKPVGAGSPMSVLREQIGSQRINEIRRQKTEWQRTASLNFASGNVNNALRSYDHAGGVEYKNGAEHTISALVKDFAEDLVVNHDKTRAVITNRNADAAALNKALRDLTRKSGMLTGEDFVVKAKGRGERAREVDMKIAVNDRLIFGKTVKSGKSNIVVQNNDTGTIVKIQANKRDKADPVVTIKMDSGKVIRKKWSELKSGKSVYAQHAYAITTYASQGLTVDKAFVYSNAGMSTSDVYVAMTRHREDAKLYVNTERMQQRSDEASDFVVNEHGQGTDEHEKVVNKKEGKDDTLYSDKEKEQFLKKLITECERDSTKTNVSNFVEKEKVAAWSRSAKSEDAKYFRNYAEQKVKADAAKLVEVAEKMKVLREQKREAKKVAFPDRSLMM
ncbi:MobF family relaxase [Acetobacter orientalis]|uniref:MobF family relaxase n=1 Tax=Acetobacter orientalis TaxID=146474 RepID=UPI0039EA8B28